MPKQRGFTKKKDKKGDWKREKPERKNNMNNNMVENIMLMKLLNENNTNTDKIMQMMMLQGGGRGRRNEISPLMLSLLTDKGNESDNKATSNEMTFHYL